LNDEVDAGVIIHENRFTYQQRGLVKIMDLGEYWEQQTGAPIPLGGIVAKKTLDAQKVKMIDELIKESVQYSFKNYPEISDYIKQHSQEMEESVMRQHIDLYVNNFSIDLGEEGKKAVATLVEVYNSMQP
jgi:1,4-dihydroxy-6-naphthoate synthase